MHKVLQLHTVDLRGFLKPLPCDFREGGQPYNPCGFVTDTYIEMIYIEIMIGDIFGNELQTTTFKIESQSKRHMNRKHKVRVIGYI